MLRFSLTLILLITLLIMNSVSAQSTKESKNNILIVYLSRTGNTEAVAEIIHEKMGGEMVKLELETLYPEDYNAIVTQMDRENETGYLPPLKFKNRKY